MVTRQIKFFVMHIFLSAFSIFFEGAAIKQFTKLVWYRNILKEKISEKCHFWTQKGKKTQLIIE